MSREAIAAANAEADHWKRKFEASEKNLADLQADRDAKAKEVLRLRGVATDRAYMMRAYRNMLGPKGAEVAEMWDRQGVKRFHADWTPAAGGLSGEEIAKAILEWEWAPKRRVLNVDTGELAPEPDPGPKAGRTHADGGGE